MKYLFQEVSDQELEVEEVVEGTGMVGGTYIGVMYIGVIRQNLRQLMYNWAIIT
jgi:hypothetical protein